MPWLLKMLALYDLWFEWRVRNILLWLEEWLSISQRRAEQGMIVIYTVCMVAGPGLFWLRGWTSLAITLPMWVMHLRPAAQREPTYHPVIMRILRVVLIQGIIWGNVAIFLSVPPHHYWDIFRALGQPVYLVCFYSFFISSNGQRGRRRKLAMAELKELFGEIGWIPKPVTEGA